ncbi:hypothetical protein T484DRAFT_1902737 [Baffinella frigidus]|nr:hypothetical protein T484DRAFT_1902737 [Cryptophyta sp. CCMP2293]
MDSNSTSYGAREEARGSDELRRLQEVIDSDVRELAAEKVVLLGSKEGGDVEPGPLMRHIRVNKGALEGLFLPLKDASQIGLRPTFKKVCIGVPMPEDLPTTGGCGLEQGGATPLEAGPPRERSCVEAVMEYLALECSISEADVESMLSNDDEFQCWV